MKITLDFLRIIGYIIYRDKRDTLSLERLKMAKLEGKKEELYLFASSVLNEWFEEGKGLMNVPLKNYTSGDHDNIGFEVIIELIINETVESYNISDRVEINQIYITDPKELFDRQRMDQHLYIDGKLAIIEEDRAFIDKPFYNMKRGVVKSFMELPHTKDILVDEPIFIFLSLGRVLNDCQRKTADFVFGHG